MSKKIYISAEDIDTVATRRHWCLQNVIQILNMFWKKKTTAHAYFATIHTIRSGTVRDIG